MLEIDRNRFCTSYCSWSPIDIKNRKPTASFEYISSQFQWIELSHVVRVPAHRHVMSLPIAIYTSQTTGIHDRMSSMTHARVLDVPLWARKHPPEYHPTETLSLIMREQWFISFDILLDPVITKTNTTAQSSEINKRSTNNEHDQSRYSLIFSKSRSAYCAGGTQEISGPCRAT